MNPEGEKADFGPYRMLNLLGRGGMGEVYRAYDTSTDRVVAIKLLPPHLAQDEEFRARFLREARVAAGLNEPHVVPIHRFGEFDGRLYVDMRFIEGQDLAKVVAQGPMAPQRVVTIIDAVAAALEAAHRAGLVHRDVKPSNILLSHRDFAYLIDFGIAMTVDDTGMTRTGHAVGSLAYMAPERLSGGYVDGRSDVYALACVLYECLTGRRAFPARTAGEQVTAHLIAPPPRPSLLGFSPALDQVIAAGLAKDPNDRYPSPDMLAQATRTVLGGGEASQPTIPTQPWRRSAEPPPAPIDFVRRPPWWRRHPVTLTAVLAVLTVAATVGGLLVANHDGSGVARNVDMNTLLVAPREIQSILGEDYMAPTSRGDAPNDIELPAIRPSDCYAAMYLAPENIRDPGTYVAMRSMQVFAAGEGHLPHVAQVAVEFASAAAARKFFDTNATAWEACQNEDVTFDNDGYHETSRFDGFTNTADVVTVKRHLVEAQAGFECQNAMGVKLNFVVMTRACSFDLTDQATQVVDKITSKLVA